MSREANQNTCRIASSELLILLNNNTRDIPHKNFHFHPGEFKSGSSVEELGSCILVLLTTLFFLFKLVMATSFFL